MNATIHARLDAYWAKVSQTDPDDLASPTLVVPHGPALGDYSGLYVVVRQNRVMVSAPPLVTSVNYWALDADAAQDPHRWQHHLPGWTILGPSTHAFADRIPTPTHDPEPV